MSNVTNYAEKLLLDWILTTGSATRPTAWFASLHTGDPGETGASELSSGSGYARQSASFAAAVDPAGTTTNQNALTFGPAATSNWGTVSGVGIVDMSTLGSGNFLFAGLLATARVVAIGDSLQIASGSLVVQMS